MPDNGVGADLERFRIGLDFVEIFPPEALGRQLDGRQRVLDFVRNAPGDICPGRQPLRRLQVCDVVEGDDEAHDLFVEHFRGHADQQGEFLAVPFDDDLRPLLPAGVRQDTGQHFAHLRHHLTERLAELGAKVGCEEFRCGAVRQIDTPVGVEADDACGDAGEHGLGELAPRVDLLVRLDQLPPVAVKLAGHAVERAT